jgi:colicin import membrane protein
MASFVRENSGPVIYSVLLHGALAAALVYLTLGRTHPPVSMQSAPINATIVDSQILRAAQRAQADEAARAAAQVRAAAEAQAAAKAAADAQALQQAMAARAQRDAEEAQAASTAKASQQAKQAQVAKQAEAAREVESAKEAQAAAATRAQQEAKRQAEAKTAEDAKRQSEAKAAAEAKAVAEAKAAADAKAAAEAKTAAEAKAAAKAADERARVEELRRQMAEEEHVAAVQSGPLADRYRAALQARIQKAWIKPPSARVGIDCLVEVTQVPGGEVTSAKVTQCNGDAAVRQSIENAVYRASPLPDPPDPALFQRNFAFRFKPDE